MIDKALFVLCYLKRDDQFLMIHRNKAPNKGKWNCVGGHIEPGETPYAACLREVLEETGYRIPEPTFHGLLTWEGFEIPLGGLYMFSSEAPAGQDAVTNGEGELEWKTLDWVLTSNDVVDNLHLVTPHVLAGEPPQCHHFAYRDGHMVDSRISELPAWVDIYQPLSA